MHCLSLFHISLNATCNVLKITNLVHSLSLFLPIPTLYINSLTHLFPKKMDDCLEFQCRVKDFNPANLAVIVAIASCITCFNVITDYKKSAMGFYEIMIEKDKNLLMIYSVLDLPFLLMVFKLVRYV